MIPFEKILVFDVFRLDGSLWIRYNTSSDKKVANCKACNDLGMASRGEWRRIEDDILVELIRQSDEKGLLNSD